MSALMDKTSAIRRRPAVDTGNIDRTTGEFVDEDPEDLDIMIHVSKAKEDEILPGGVHVERGETIVHLEKALDVLVGDTLVFWDRDWQVVVDARPSYDTLAAVIGHTRRRLLVRELKPS